MLMMAVSVIGCVGGFPVQGPVVKLICARGGQSGQATRAFRVVVQSELGFPVHWIATCTVVSHRTVPGERIARIAENAPVAGSTAAVVDPVTTSGPPAVVTVTGPTVTWLPKQPKKLPATVNAVGLKDPAETAVT